MSEEKLTLQDYNDLCFIVCQTECELSAMKLKECGIDRSVLYSKLYNIREKLKKGLVKKDEYAPCIETKAYALHKALLSALLKVLKEEKK